MIDIVNSKLYKLELQVGQFFLLYIHKAVFSMSEIWLH